MRIITTNPSTEQPIASYPLMDEQTIERYIGNGYDAFLQWKALDFSKRKRLMLAVAELLRTRCGVYAELMADEMGKPIKQGVAEIEKCVWICEHYAAHAKRYLQSRPIKTEKKLTKVCYQPLGVIFAIMPWNFPFWQVFRFVVPTLMAGNAAILKHAPISTGTGNAIAELFFEAGSLPSLFQHFILDNRLAQTVIAHEKIAAVTLTGSERAGKAVASVAANHLKKVVLELGGSDPYIVLADADIALAALAIVTSRMNNSGQVCIAAKRVIVLRSVANALIEQLVSLTKAYRMGNPRELTTDLGPLARDDLRASLHQQVSASIALGAKLLLGGEIPSQVGYYYPPTILSEVTPGMPAFDQELFGPVISVTMVETEQEAIQLANQSCYGLGAAIFTRNESHGLYLAEHQIEAGSCFVNSYVTSDPRVPFGGIKQSGFGRELSREGILAFVNVKTIAAT